MVVTRSLARLINLSGGFCRILYTKVVLMLLPRAHALGVKPTSRDLGMCETRKHDESVEVGEKLASACFKSFGVAHERHK